MTSQTFELIREGKFYALRNRQTGQVDHSGFASRAMAKEFLALHFGEVLR
jgi:hypothetical protein